MAEIEVATAPEKSLNFIEKRIVEDLAEGKNGGRLQTRFPPEPNGYLHIGHAKAIAMDFGVAKKFGGVCNLRMDDTNPQKEDIEYVRAIERDIKWLGFEWGKVVYASDYFQDLWDFAEWCILNGRAYVDEQTSEEIAAQKGTSRVLAIIVARVVLPTPGGPHRIKLLIRPDAIIRERTAPSPTRCSWPI